MTVIGSLQHCGKCGAALSGYAPDGLCGACMLESAFEDRDAGTGGQSTATPLLSFKDYELLEEIARGGMGVVYRARQISLNRIVAIKMMLGGHLANATEVHRFRAEAETAAQLQHPNIVTIHEVGEHAGQPFFSMDLILGRNLAQLVREKPLAARKAAECVKTIAEAVHFAHSRGVLHRDLKPSNILIDDLDQPRITDFGLAKRFNDSELSTNDSELTQTGQVLGSPSFIPPEQAAGQRATIGPASDIYSIGAILYYCLTGRPPFVAETMTATLRMVAENEAVSPRLLNASLPRDLETICLKCLEKEPSRRYATAQDLADELGRFLRDVPIRVRPVSQAEKLWRWCRRKPALATVVFLVVVVAVGSPVAAFRINRERRQAVANEEKAQLAAARSQQVAQFLKDMLAGVGPSVALGRDTVMLREILDRTAARVGKDLTNQPEVEAELRSTVGEVYSVLGQDDKAEPMHREALKLRRQLFGNEHLDVADSLFKLAVVRQNQGDFVESEAMHRESLNIRRKLVSDESAEIAESQHGLADALLAQAKATEAEPLYRESLRINRKLFGEVHEQVAHSLRGLADLLMHRGEWTEAENLRRQTLAIWRKLFGEEHPEVADALSALCLVLRKEAKLDEAEATCNAALALQKRLLGNEHIKIAESLNNLAAVELDRGELAEAEAAFGEAIAVAKKVHGDEHPDVASLLNNRAFVLARMGKLVQAEELFRACLAMHQKLHGNQHPETATALDNLGSVLVYEDRFEEAEKSHRAALAIRRASLGAEHPLVATSLNNVALALSSQHKTAEAEVLYVEALAMKKKLLGNDHPSVAHALEELAIVMGTQGKFADAELLLQEEVGILQKTRPDDWSTFGAVSLLGRCLVAQKKYMEAEPLLLSGYEGMKQREGKMPAIAKGRLKDCVEQIVRLYREAGPADKAVVWEAKLSEFDRLEPGEKK